MRDLVVTSLREITARPRVIAGEIAHHLRASLDLLAYHPYLRGLLSKRAQVRFSFSFSRTSLANFGTFSRHCHGSRPRVEAVPAPVEHPRRSVPRPAYLVAILVRGVM